jgi:type III secretion protein D
VLTGQHAGANLEWTQSTLRVGSSEALDVYISDWNVQQIELHDEQGRHRACWPQGDADVAVAGATCTDGQVSCALAAWAPVRFGAIILCIGPADEPWPDDAELLGRCFLPAPPPDVVRAPRRWPRTGRSLGVIAITASLALLTDTGAVRRADGAVAPVLASEVSASEPVPAASPAVAQAAGDAVQQLRRAIEPKALQGLELEAAAERVIVRGVLDTRGAVDQLNNRLDALPPSLPVSRRFVALPAVIDRLHESLPGLQVRQAGPASFEVSGTVDDVQRARGAIAQQAVDLAELGVKVFGTPQPRSAGLPAMTGMLIDSQGASYIRTRDGAKHLVSWPASAPANPQITTARTARGAAAVLASGDRP